MRTHTGENPFMCNMCDKGYKSKKALHKHNLMTHSHYRPFKCERCNAVR